MLSRWMIYGLMASAIGAGIAGCDNNTNKRVAEVKAAAVSLGQTPSQFQTQYNASLDIVVPVVLKNSGAVVDQNLISMYQINQLKHLQGKEQGLIESNIGPLRIHLIGKVNDKDELMSIGGNLRDNGDKAKQDFMVMVTTIAYVMTGASPQKLMTTLQSLMTTVLANPDQVIAASVDKTVFTASLSNIGITIEAAHVQ